MVARKEEKRNKSEFVRYELDNRPIYYGICRKSYCEKRKIVTSANISLKNEIYVHAPRGVSSLSGCGVGSGRNQTPLLDAPLGSRTQTLTSLFFQNPTRSKSVRTPIAVQELNF